MDQKKSMRAAPETNLGESGRVIYQQINHILVRGAKKKIIQIICRTIGYFFYWDIWDGIYFGWITCVQTTLTANQNTCYISLYIIHVRQFFTNIYFVNFKHITNNFRV